MVELRILSADAPKLGLRRCAEIHREETGTAFALELATAPAISDLVTSGRAAADLVVVPLAAMNKLADAGKVERATITPMGAVAVGVVVKNGTWEPDLSSVASFVDAVHRAASVVYNRASSGLYVAEMLERLGLTRAIEAKVTIVQTGAAVMEHLVSHAPDLSIGFGHVTEICLHDDKGTHLVGVLPAAIGRETMYAAAVLTSAAAPAAAAEFVAALGCERARTIFAGTGVIPPGGGGRADPSSA